MPSSVLPHPPAAPSGNGATFADTAAPAAVASRHQPRDTARTSRSPLLAKLTGLTSIAMVAAAGMIVVGILAIVGGRYDKQTHR